jgi:hypothetical protein
LTYGKLRNCKVLTKSFPKDFTSRLRKTAVVNVKFDECLVTQHELGQKLCSNISQVAVPEIQVLQRLVMGAQRFAHLCHLLAANVTISEIQKFNLGINLEDHLEKLKIVRTEEVLTQV